ncbi:hypothetical protein GF389_05980, partial [Candidatus Dojkabacteria bacterium]|nr:hypothetical protein [Candidatus Dojkabacteria bacterium]
MEEKASEVSNSSAKLKFQKKLPISTVFMLVAGLAVVLICIITILTLYYFYQKDQNDVVGGDNQETQKEDEGTNEEEVGENETEEVEEETTEFVGTYVSGDLPDGWTITEYEDGAGGYGLLADGVYEGLTAITVSNPASEEVFKIELVNGIGGTGECSQVYQFADTEASYVQDQQDLAFGLSGTNPPVVNLAGQDYIEFSLFGMEGRFLGNDVYWNVADASSNHFNPACNMLQVALDDTGLSADYTQSGSTM